MTILFESAIRVTLIAAIIALVLFAMRIKTASVLHAVWASVIFLMMLLPAWVAWGPKASSRSCHPSESCHRALAPAVTGGACIDDSVPAPSPTPPPAPHVRAGDTSRFICLVSGRSCCASPSAPSARSG